MCKTELNVFALTKILPYRDRDQPTNESGIRNEVMFASLAKVVLSPSLPGLTRQSIWKMYFAKIDGCPDQVRA
jgi:hypothetical protein